MNNGIESDSDITHFSKLILSSNSFFLMIISRFAKSCVDLPRFLKTEEAAGKAIYPPRGTRLAALELTPLDAVKVVILGQDPYHGPGQAHGLSFSVQDGVKVPPSLVNIYKELASDLGLPVPRHGNLTHWARQGVLLLNAALTVEDGQPASHARKGWETLTDALLGELGRVAQRGDAQHAAAAGVQLAVDQRGAGVEDLQVVGHRRRSDPSGSGRIASHRRPGRSRR